MTNQLQLYKAVELFNGLTNEQIEALITISQEEVYQEDQVIFSQDDEGEKMYIIRSGQVEISVQANRQAPAETKIFLGQGQIFGEIALIDYGTRSATVRAMNDETIVDAIHRDSFNQLCQSSTAIGFVVMRNLAIDLSYKLRHQNLRSTKR
ncbi:MAG: cyclic nucleotide-binding domain-containing protein [Chloroflexi bacterium]|nr:MAG: cyclic nucleotide-binding domain-containing protein [Anaerolineae bacterium]MBZ0319316.1 cyclic nucleotide-binding domain-containing protein [Anaerolineae bacterium]MCQ3931135.1 cyclic nucleotide-binding domain-containing protein [Chloroflexota bacterium]